MVFVNEAEGYRVCLECQDVLVGGDEYAWMARHTGPDGCEQDAAPERADA